VDDAAHGIRQVANANMARAIRAVTVERGKDPRDMALMAFGGGGPLHAVDVARLLGIRRVLITPFSGVFSAAGMLAAETVHEFVRPILIPFADVAETLVQNLLGDMVDDGRAALAGEGYDEDAVEFRFAADIRYLGQSSQLMIQMPSKSYGAADLRAAFERTYRETFGYIADGEPLELVNLRLSAIGKATSRLEFGKLNLDSRALAAEKGERLVSFGRGASRIPARVLPRAVAQATVVAGPAIIESYDTTIVVPPGCTARPAGAGCLAIEMGEMDV
jgi:N-methylhydantoinase A